MTPESEHSILQFERIIKDAMIQSALLEVQHEDKIYQSMGREFFYCIDSNILDLLCDPASMAISTERLKIGVGDVFRQDSEERKKDIAASVAFYISQGLNEGVPLIVFQPIDQEIRKYLDRLQRDFQEPLSSADPERESSFKSVALRIAEAGVNLMPSDLHKLREAYLADPTVSAVLERFRRLMRSGRILRSDIAAKSPQFPEKVRAALNIGGDTTSMLDISFRKKQWLEAFRVTGRHISVRAEHDAEALARLCIVNSRLRRFSNNYVLSYLTLDHTIIDAGQVYRDFDNGYAADFIRNPRSFLGEEGVLRPSRVGDGEAESTTSLREMFFVLVGGFEQGEKGSTLKIKDADFSRSEKLKIETFLRKSPTAIPDLLKRWSDFEASISAEPPPNAIRKLKSLLDNLSKGHDMSVIEACVQEVRNSQAEAWDAFWETNIGARYLLQSSSNSVGQRNVPSRDVPILCFEDRPILQEFLIKAKRWMLTPEEMDAIEYTRLRQCVLDEDDTGYGDALAHSFLLALHMQWQSAAILAGRAKEIATDRSTMEPGGSNGREAHYFEAFCRRHAFASHEDFHNLRNDVQSAKTIAENEAEVHSKKYPKMAKTFPHDVVPIRFDAELLAIDITEILVAWEAGGHRLDILEKLANILGPLQELMRMARLQWRELNGEEEAVPAVPTYLLTRSQRMAILDQTIIRVARNILAIALQLHSAIGVGREVWEVLADEERARRALGDSNYLDAAQVRSDFMRVVHACAQYIFCGRTATVRRELEKIRNEIQKRKPTQFTFSYDKARYLDMIEKALSAR